MIISLNNIGGGGGSSPSYFPYDLIALGNWDKNPTASRTIGSGSSVTLTDSMPTPVLTGLRTLHYTRKIMDQK